MLSIFFNSFAKLVKSPTDDMTITMSVNTLVAIVFRHNVS